MFRFVALICFSPVQVPTAEVCKPDFQPAPSVLAISQPLQFPEAERYPPGAVVYDGTPTGKLQSGEIPDLWQRLTFGGDLPCLVEDNFDPAQFRAGLGVELEHSTENQTTEVTKDDPLKTGKIALAHLTEFPDYYTRLARMEAEAKSFWDSKESEG